MSREPCRHGNERYCSECAAESSAAKVPGLRARVSDLEAEVERLRPLEERSLSGAEARAVLAHLAGKGEMGLDYLHAREKLKATVENET